jgi:ABC-2 type transport system permease protein
MKDLRLMTRDKLGMFFIIGFPLLMGVFFGAITGSFGSGGARLSLAIDDQDGSKMSERFVESIGSNQGLTIQHIPREEAMNLVRRGKKTGMIVIPPGFGESAGVLWEDAPEIEVGIDPSRKAEAGMIEGLVMQAMGGLVMERFQDVENMRGMIESSRQKIRTAPDVNMPTRLAVEAIMGSLDSLMDAIEETQEADGNGDGNGDEGGDEGGGLDMGSGRQLASIKPLDVTRQLDPNSPSALVKKLRSKWDISFPQATLWGVLGCVAGFAVLTVRERSIGTMVRLQVAPLPPYAILAGKGLACFLAVVFVVTAMTAVGYALGMRPKRWDFLALATLCTAACFVGIMMVISTVGKSEQAVSGAIWGANVMMAMFGGGMIPIAFMPEFMQPLSNITPVKWSILALEGAIWREFSLAEMLLPCGILLAIAVVGMIIGSVVLSRQLRNA